MVMDQKAASRAVLLEVLQIAAAFRDKLVVVGGLVPELYFPGKNHIGSLDVDLAVSIGALDKNAYQSLASLLLKAGYSHQTGPTRFIRQVNGLKDPIKLDLICGQYQTGEKVDVVPIGELAINTLRGLDLAFDNPVMMDIVGTMPDGTKNTVKAQVVRLDAYILVKAFALNERKKEKDAYDIAFVLANYQPNLKDLAARVRGLLGNGLAKEGLEILKSKFSAIDTIGPVWAAQVYRENGDDFDQAQRAAFENAQSLFSAI